MNIQHALTAGRALGTLQQSGILAHPLVKMGLRYWWLSVPAGLALYGRIKERREKGERKIHHYFGAAAEVFGPLMTVVAMAELASKLQREGKLDTRIDERIAASQQTGTEQPSMQGVSRLNGDVLHPPQYTEDVPPPHLQRA